MGRNVRTIIISLVVCAVLLCFLTPARSDEGPPVFTLEESISMALERSLHIRSARELVRESESLRKERFTSFLPALSTSYGYRRLDETPTMSFPGMGERTTGTRDNYVWSLELTQPVFTGGALSGSYDLAARGVHISKLQETTTIQDVVLDVREAYFAILTAERVREVALQAVEQLRAHRDTAQSFYDVGVIPRNDLLHAEVELADGIQNLMVAENSLELAKARFNTVLRRDIGAPVAVEDILTYRPFEGNLEACLAEAMAGRSELEIYELQVQQSERAVNVTKSGFYPSVAFTANYSRYGDTPGVSGNSYTDKDDWYLLAVAKWNFWEWGKTRYAVDASRRRVDQARNARDNLSELIALEVKNAYLSLREAEHRIAVTEAAVLQAEENYRLNVERYREQVGTTTEVIDAQTLLTRARSSYFNALSAYHLALGELERAMGTIYEVPGNGG
ncbi:MAG: TolC family protein [Syntrophales bacterium]|nr:TolC family protein [Syntrophales bacterium]MCK9527342.1 TolC family protein [Syntrophales bacterium]MDX9921188.1 TolC family protein [Syntrophales bacterium]